MAYGVTIERMTDDERTNAAAKEVQAVLDRYHVKLQTAHQFVITAEAMPVKVEEVVVAEEPKAE